MITIEDLKKLEVADDKAAQIIEMLGDASKKISSVNEAKTAYDNVDRAVLTLTGIAKDTNQTTTDYLKSAFTGPWLQTKVQEKSNELSTKLTELEEKLKNHKGDETLKAEIATLKSEKEKLPEMKEGWIKEYKEKAENYEKQISKMEREYRLREFIPANVRADVDKEFLKYKVDQTLQEASKFDKIEVIDGKTYLVDSVNVDRTLAQDWFAAKFDNVIDKGQAQSGGGAGKATQQKQSGNGKIEFEADATLGSKVNSIRAHIITQEGISEFDPRYDVRLNELMIEHELAPKAASPTA